MKKTQLFLLALIMAGLTTYLFYHFLQGMKVKEVASSTPMTTVVVAKVAIPPNTQITAQMVVLKQVAASSVQPDATTSLDKVTGQISAVEIKPNEMILSHHLESMNQANSLADKIQPGYEAITVTAGKMADNVANLIEPGDSVDVVLNTKNKTTLLLQKVPVLAVDQRMTPPNPKDPYKPYSMTTLEVTPDQAIKILSSEQKGNVTLVLRSANKEEG